MLPLSKAALAAIAALTVGPDSSPDSSPDSRTVCRDSTGTDHGHFYTFWHDTGAGCMTLGRAGSYSVDWHLGERGNLVAGKGWAKGSPDRIIRYRARTFVPGTNGYLALYGWSTDPLVKYYVVENWGDFTPPGTDAIPLGVVTSDGGTYRVYRTRRVDFPSIAGKATFDQYWSVRTVKRRTGRDHRITFGNHVAASRRLGLPLGTLTYQVVATKGFGSTAKPISASSIDDRRMLRRLFASAPPICNRHLQAALAASNLPRCTTSEISSS